MFDEVPRPLKIEGPGDEEFAGESSLPDVPAIAAMAGPIRLERAGSCPGKNPKPQKISCFR